MGAAGFSWRQCSLPSVQGQAEYLKSQSPPQAFFNHLIFFFRRPNEETQLFVSPEVMSPQLTCQSRIPSSSEQADPSKEPRNLNGIIEIPDTDDEEYDSDRSDNVLGQISGTVVQSPARTPPRKLRLRNQIKPSQKDFDPVSLRRNQKRKRTPDHLGRDIRDGENKRTKKNMSESHLVQPAKNTSQNTNCINCTLGVEQSCCRVDACTLDNVFLQYTENLQRYAQRADHYTEKYTETLLVLMQKDREIDRLRKKKHKRGIKHKREIHEHKREIHEHEEEKVEMQKTIDDLRQQIRSLKP
ncbi:hypothetical protein AA0119_g13490 [Alternaria tenuissima]|uniref:Uncharacterized protein n=2 Tax=Alternaria alternata complex TaxID=187734 RepID=A0A4Q4MQF8_ALTAL|nr:hypothetical protein AA0115_g12577 [Alternaria tenuissima]RYN28577.1 hypothetical protein AA0114_g12448 [Alternaria tenuissima]RYN56238.1 hypothetical protein AA0117_g13266 [Alternaria alternata]RYN80667.1 hypothetical protein AA0119_g13490 [Alternaria tenuissima]RYN98516.1 hypothetical protein AA0121_g13510 [Alternaria tenuissima]